jgi:hypothetical protein
MKGFRKRLRVEILEQGRETERDGPLFAIF